MQRVIKFRAWDSLDKKLIADIAELQYTERINCGDGFGDREAPRFPYKEIFSGYLRSRYLLMQFTGLHDKNGVEIYEGDILQDYDNERIGVVSFEDGAFVVRWENEVCNAYEWSDEVVIGNIYQNKNSWRHNAKTTR